MMVPVNKEEDQSRQGDRNRIKYRGGRRVPRSSRMVKTKVSCENGKDSDVRMLKRE